MINKIKVALQQGHKNLGITDEEVFERVASAAQTFITDESQIPAFVSNAEPMLKLYQSQADKARTLQRKISELEAKQTIQEPPKPKVDDSINPTPAQASPNIEEIVANAIAKAISPIAEEFNSFKAEKQSTDAIAQAKKKFDSDDWANSNNMYAKVAWKQAMKRFEDKGKNMSADELYAEAKDNLNDLFATKGVDSTKPFEGRKGGADNEPNLDATEKMLRNRGKLPKVSEK